MENQPTSTPVSDGLARHYGRVIEDAMRKYPGGSAKAELAKGHTGLVSALYELVDRLAAERHAMALVGKARFLIIGKEDYEKYNSRRKIMRALRDNGYDSVSKDAERLIRGIWNIFGPADPEDREFVTATAADFGFPEGCTLRVALEAAAKVGLEACSTLDGALIALLMPKGSKRSLSIAMHGSADPITCRMCHFCIANEPGNTFGHPELALYTQPNKLLDPNRPWIFRRKKTSAES